MKIKTFNEKRFWKDKAVFRSLKLRDNVLEKEKFTVYGYYIFEDLQITNFGITILDENDEIVKIYDNETLYNELLLFDNGFPATAHMQSFNMIITPFGKLSDYMFAVAISYTDTADWKVKIEIKLAKLNILENRFDTVYVTKKFNLYFTSNSNCIENDICRNFMFDHIYIGDKINRDESIPELENASGMVMFLFKIYNMYGTILILRCTLRYINDGFDGLYDNYYIYADGIYFDYIYIYEKSIVKGWVEKEDVIYQGNPCILYNYHFGLMDRNSITNESTFEDVTLKFYYRYGIDKIVNVQYDNSNPVLTIEDKAELTQPYIYYNPNVIGNWQKINNYHYFLFDNNYIVKTKQGKWQRIQTTDHPSFFSNIAYPIGFYSDNKIYLFITDIEYNPIEETYIYKSKNTGYFYLSGILPDNYENVTISEDNIFSVELEYDPIEMKIQLNTKELGYEIKTFETTNINIYKKIFQADTAFIEEEHEPQPIIELFDDNNNLLFWGYSEDGWDYKSGKYQSDYVSFINNDLMKKIDKNYEDATISDIIEDIINTYADFIILGTIEPTTNTYNLKETRTIREFLQWASYVEQKIVSFTPDGVISFITAILNENDEPFEIEMQDPNKSYKISKITPTKFYVIGGLKEGQRLYASQINDQNGLSFVMYHTNITDQTELNNILAKMVAMKSQTTFKMDFINYSDLKVYPLGTIFKFIDEQDPDVDGRECIVTAVDHNPAIPETTSYVVYNSINYPQQQDQDQQRITIIEQDMEKQIGFSAFCVYINTDTPLLNTINAKLNYPNVEYDLNNDYNTVNNRFIAPYNGIYHFDASILTRVQNYTAGQVYVAILYKNGILYMHGHRWVVEANITAALHSSVSADIILNKDDYVEVWYFIQGAGRSTDNQSTYNKFQGHLVRRID